MDAKLNNLIIGSDEDRIAAIVRLFRSLGLRARVGVYCSLLDIVNAECKVEADADPSVVTRDGEQPEDNG